ncbi:MAG TPA: hypothetical protein EYP36_01785 [Calditrichaeota bacterium]|nr:hypothetical protein [Calditrichota bacterium]
MHKTYIRWILALLITLSAAAYQRLTGPTYPVNDTININGQTVSYELLRSHGGDGNQPVTLAFTDTSYKAYVVYKRYKTDEAWQKIPMQYNNNGFYAELPHQPPAGKLEYYILVENGNNQITIPAKTTVVTRFKGDVPAHILVPHIVFMFLAFLFSNLTGLEAITRGPRLARYAFITLGLLFIGGMILGPIVQKYAFDAYWTGIPFGYDLTDNKTLIAVLGWLLAVWAVWKRRDRTGTRWIVVFAAVLLLAVFSIPHSMMGSELDYNSMEIKTGK